MCTVICDDTTGTIQHSMQALSCFMMQRKAKNTEYFCQIYNTQHNKLAFSYKSCSTAT